MAMLMLIDSMRAFGPTSIPAVVGRGVSQPALMMGGAKDGPFVPLVQGSALLRHAAISMNERYDVTLDDYREFAKWDTDQSQSVDFAEFLALQPKEVLWKYGESEIKKWFDEADLNGDGVIDFNEFCVMKGKARDNQPRVAAVAAKAPPGPTMDDYRRFAAVDTDQNQSIDFPEFLALQSQEVLWTYSVDQIRAWFDSADTDGNGQLDFDEYFALTGPGAKFTPPS